MEKIQLGFILLLAFLCAGVTQTTTPDNSGGHCPHDYARYNPNIPTPGCGGECEGDQDCSDGEICCVKTSQSEYQCPVCRQPEYGKGCDTRFGEYYYDGEIFNSYNPYYYYGCTICQCINGEVNCFNTCDEDRFALREWIVPSITAAVALLVVLIVSLVVCCCVKCCCKTGHRTVYHGVGTPVQRPNNYQTCPPYMPNAGEREPLVNPQVA
ncbi:uncharacterized protein LOC119742189 isoform X1 [Patiria miniata]|uniref:Uncharacterized protein n=1 Tax=Patiria miniata TaxID=46514 RepID=A0A914BDS8_PATMI|nr:uncharacterized protein LOC119742178 isoform X1 [Patiria miniata]XP_038074156.1 uncharacterized protein LOC119742189 isoform X1 [Patiria miniata]